MEPRSEACLVGVHPLLAATTRDAYATCAQHFVVVQGLRTDLEQEALYAKGRTAPGPIVTFKDGVKDRSNHQAAHDGTGHAVDCAAKDPDGSINWTSTAEYATIGKAMDAAAAKHGITLRHGAEWGDYDHFEILAIL
jgi:peptidoglycan L-alanyl-D-glutamate endopeptidase CwlK